MTYFMHFQGLKRYVKLLFHTYQTTRFLDQHSIEHSADSIQNCKWDSWLNVGEIWSLRSTDILAIWFDIKTPNIIQSPKAQCSLYAPFALSILSARYGFYKSFLPKSCWRVQEEKCFFRQWLNIYNTFKYISCLNS